MTERPEELTPDVAPDDRELCARLREYSRQVLVVTTEIERAPRQLQREASLERLECLRDAALSALRRIERSQLRKARGPGHSSTRP
ncbi:MAG: hypothetical protein M3068_04500 [Gemmatimonadota bacterium]|nr:hypothetical protein [Gemmatimonadota bacterium]